MDKDVKGQEKTYDQKHVDGLVKDLQGERSERQKYQFELDQTKKEIDSLKQTVQGFEAKKEQKSVTSKLRFGEDDDAVTNKQLKENLKELEETATEKMEKVQKKISDADKKVKLQQKYKESCNAAITKYIERKDIGLDWETVYQAAVKQIGGNKYAELALYTASNPGEAIYKKGCEDPEIKEKLALLKNKDVLDTVDKRKVDKKGLEGSSKGEVYTFEKVSKMTQKQIMEHLPEIQEAQKNWENPK